MNIPIETTNYLGYITTRRNDLKLAKELYKKYKQVTYSKTNHWVSIGGVTLNSITKEDMEAIINETIY